MKGLKKIVIKATTTIADRCNDKWLIGTGAPPSNLERLAMAMEGEEIIDDDGDPFNIIGDMSWHYCCTKHNTKFQPWSGCPKSNRELAEGEVLELNAILAESLVVGGFADYVQEQKQPSSVAVEKLGRVNDLLDRMGLPTMTEEEFGVYSTVDKIKTKARPRPKDRQLADDLGISDDDIAEMKKLL